MLAAKIASSLLVTLAQLLSFALFLTGLVVLIRGKLAIFGHALRAGPARLAGGYLIAQFVVGMLSYALLHDSLKLGYSNTPVGDQIVGESVQGVVFLLVTIGGIALVRSTARSRGERVIVQPGAAQRHHGCLLALLILMVIACFFSAVSYLVFPDKIAKAYPGAPAWAPVGIRIVAVLSLVMVAALVAIWNWRKWGVYLFALMALCVLALNVMLVGLPNALVGLIGFGLVLAFVFREWKHYH